jgi:hypothetical protein
MTVRLSAGEEAGRTVPRVNEDPQVGHGDHSQSDQHSNRKTEFRIRGTCLCDAEGESIPSCRVAPVKAWLTIGEMVGVRKLRVTSARIRNCH